LKSKKKKINANYLVKYLKKVSISKLQNSNLHSIAVSNKVSEIARYFNISNDEVKRILSKLAREGKVKFLQRQNV
jgi:Mn-dependent DtxR family transcriptional regulator